MTNKNTGIIPEVEISLGGKTYPPTRLSLLIYRDAENALAKEIARRKADDPNDTSVMVSIFEMTQATFTPDTLIALCLAIMKQNGERKTWDEVAGMIGFNQLNDLITTFITAHFSAMAIDEDSAAKNLQSGDGEAA